MHELNVTWMYPDILNLHGDRGNILALIRVGSLLGVKVNVYKVESYEDLIDFKNTDILFFNPGEIKVMPFVINALNLQKNELNEYVNSNKIIIVIASSGIIMAKNTIRTDGSSIDGFGYLDMECYQREKPYGDDIHFETLGNQPQEIIGCQIHMVDTKLNGASPFR